MRRVFVPLELAPAIPLRARDAELVTFGGQTMGTTWSVQLFSPAQVSSASLRSGIEAVLDGVINQMSPWIEDSDISRFNRAAAGTWCALPEDFAFVLRHALQVAAQSEGAYDPTVGALVDLWGFGPHGRPGEVPDDHAIENARAHCGWSRVKLDGVRAFQPGGVRIDLSSIAKGFAVDRVSAYLANRGLPDHLVEIGGELRGQGTKPDGSPWWVATERFDSIENLVALHGLAIATSGDSQRYFEGDGQRLSHTLDPRTGRPVAGDLFSVTVLHRQCMCADALATALLVLGPDKGLRLANELSVPALFTACGTGPRERMSTALKAMLG